MARFKIELEYEGTRYAGWQIQKNARTVQGEIFTAIRKVFDTERFEFHGSSRTDTGVHALAQVAHLDVATSWPAAEVVARINTRLPSDIAFIRAIPVDRSFDARRDALARSYIYQISLRPLAFGKRYTWLVTGELDSERMRAACELFTGFKDFRSFTREKPDAGEPGQAKSTLVAIESLELQASGQLLLIRIKGSHFLWKMVRQIVGVLVELGKGRLSEAEIQQFFMERSKQPARLTAPPAGLFLEKVCFRGDELLPPLTPCLAKAFA